MSYGITFTAGSLIPSFCLSIKGRHDAPDIVLHVNVAGRAVTTLVVSLVVSYAYKIHAEVYNKNDSPVITRLAICAIDVLMAIIRKIVCHPFFLPEQNPYFYRFYLHIR